MVRPSFSSWGCSRLTSAKSFAVDYKSSSSGWLLHVVPPLGLKDELILFGLSQPWCHIGVEVSGVQRRVRGCVRVFLVVSTDIVPLGSSRLIGLTPRVPLPDVPVGPRRTSYSPSAATGRVIVSPRICASCPLIDRLVCGGSDTVRVNADDCGGCLKLHRHIFSGVVKYLLQSAQRGL
jgi:hypothetical protein